MHACALCTQSQSLLRHMSAQLMHSICPCAHTGQPNDCCPDGWTCQVGSDGVTNSCLPATSSFIPPSVDSLILDYQSPNAAAGFYPGEDNSTGGVGARANLHIAHVPFSVGHEVLPCTP